MPRGQLETPGRTSTVFRSGTLEPEHRKAARLENIEFLARAGTPSTEILRREGFTGWVHFEKWCQRAGRWDLYALVSANDGRAETHRTTKDDD